MPYIPFPQAMSSLCLYPLHSPNFFVSVFSTTLPFGFLSDVAFGSWLLDISYSTGLNWISGLEDTALLPDFQGLPLRKSGLFGNLGLGGELCTSGWNSDGRTLVAGIPDSAFTESGLFSTEFLGGLSRMLYWISWVTLLAAGWLLYIRGYSTGCGYLGAGEWPKVAAL